MYIFKYVNKKILLKNTSIILNVVTIIFLYLNYSIYINFDHFI